MNEKEFDYQVDMSIEDVRLLHHCVQETIKNWPGSPARPPEEQEWLPAMKERYFAMLMEYNFSENESVDK